MLSTNVQIDARAALRSLDRVGSAASRGTARGLNDVAFRAMRHERGDMTRRLDRPSRFTISGTQVIRARADQAEPVAIVHVEDKRAKYLAAQERGKHETRGTIGSSRGSGSDAIVIPVREIVRDQLGGAGRNAVKRALKLPRTFIARMRNQMHGGVWQRKEGGARNEIEPLLLFRDTVDFKPTLHFGDDVTAFAGPLVRRAVSRAVDYELQKAVRV